MRKRENSREIYYEGSKSHILFIIEMSDYLIHTPLLLHFYQQDLETTLDMS